MAKTETAEYKCPRCGAPMRTQAMISANGGKEVEMPCKKCMAKLLKELKKRGKRNG